MFRKSLTPLIAILFKTNEGKSAVQEAIKFLRQQQPLSPHQIN